MIVFKCFIALVIGSGKSAASYNMQLFSSTFKDFDAFSKKLLNTLGVETFAWINFRG